MQKGILLNTLNIESKTINNAIIQLGDIDDSGKGRKFSARFIQPGLVKIEGHGIVLLKKETLDASLQSIIGTPVIIEHQDITDENANDLRCGVISNAQYSEFDGWYYVDGIIWDEKAQELINKGWSVSCSYDFLAFNDDGGEENNIHYDKEFTQLNFTHLAIVDNPRYERANIIFNCKVDNENDNHYPANSGDKSGQFAPAEFANSFIKNPDNNELLDVYHGSKTDFDKFDDKLDWHFFSSDYTVGKSYSLPKKGRVFTTNINLQNPLEFNAENKSWAELDENGLRTNDLAKYAKDNGYDGVIIKDVIDVGKRFGYHKWTNEELDILSKPHTDYIVFNPDNIFIKSKDIINQIDNSKEQIMLLEELKKLITKVENEKGDDMDDKEKKEVENEKIDKRKLIDEVGGILKGKVDDEVIRTIIGKMEQASYDASEDDKADNKKVKNEAEDKEEDKKEDKEDKKVDNEEDDKDKKEADDLKEDKKEDIDNKCKNSKVDTTSFDKINAIYNSVKQITESTTYESRQQKLDNAVEYFK